MLLELWYRVVLWVRIHQTSFLDSSEGRRGSGEGARMGESCVANSEAIEKNSNLLQTTLMDSPSGFNVSLKARIRPALESSIGSSRLEK